jgi:hypothetical protein
MVGQVDYGRWRGGGDDDVWAEGKFTKYLVDLDYVASLPDGAHNFSQHFIVTAADGC